SRPPCGPGRAEAPSRPSHLLLHVSGQVGPALCLDRRAVWHERRHPDERTRREVAAEELLAHRGEPRPEPDVGHEHRHRHDVRPVAARRGDDGLHPLEHRTRLLLEVVRDDGAVRPDPALARDREPAPDTDAVGVAVAARVTDRVHREVRHLLAGPVVRHVRIPLVMFSRAVSMSVAMRSRSTSTSSPSRTRTTPSTSTVRTSARELWIATCVATSPAGRMYAGTESTTTSARLPTVRLPTTSPSPMDRAASLVASSSARRAVIGWSTPSRSGGYPKTR